MVLKTLGAPKSHGNNSQCKTRKATPRGRNGTTQNSLPCISKAPIPVWGRITGARAGDGNVDGAPGRWDG